MSPDGSAPLKLVVGLGNPGPKYRETRHNLGFMVVDRLAAAAGETLSRTRGEALFAKLRLNGRELILVKPVGYMNRSGPPVRELKDFFKVAESQLLVIHDDLDLTLGTLRFKRKGGTGGHRGIASLIGALGSDRFARLKIGIGPTPPGWDPAAFVLARFDAGEAATVEDCIARAVQAVQTWLSGGMDQAMNQFNTSAVENDTRTEQPGDD